MTNPQDCVCRETFFAPSVFRVAAATSGYEKHSGVPMKFCTIALCGAALAAFTLSAAAQESGGGTSGGAASSAPSAPAEQPAPPQTYTPPPPPPPPPPAYIPGGWYLGLGGGWDNRNNTQINDSLGNNGHLETNDNAIALGSFGYRLPQLPLRLEFEGGYTWHDINGFVENGTGFPAKGHANLGHALFNAVYDLPIAPRWALSVGAGAGAGFADYSTNVIAGSLNKNGFMWQGIGGISYHLAPNIDLFTDYRYRDAQTGTSVNVAGDNVRIHGITENAVVAGFRWYLEP